MITADVKKAEERPGERGRRALDWEARESFSERWRLRQDQNKDELPVMGKQRRGGQCSPRQGESTCKAVRHKLTCYAEGTKRPFCVHRTLGCCWKDRTRPVHVQRLLWDSTDQNILLFKKEKHDMLLSYFSLSNFRTIPHLYCEVKYRLALRTAWLQRAEKKEGRLRREWSRQWRSRTWSSPPPTDTSKLHPHMERLSQNIYWDLAEGLRLQKGQDRKSVV